MTKLKTMFGLCVLSAFAICAFAAQGASAETAFECAPAAVKTAKFKDAHCLTPEVGEAAGFKHVELPTTSTAITLTNVTTGEEKSIAKLKSVQSGVTLELQATGVHGEGTLQNVTEKEGEKTIMYAKGSGVIKYTGVTVTAPAGKGCSVVGGAVTTSKLLGTTKGLTKQLKFSPETEPFATFSVTGCSVTALNHEYKATGSVIGNTSGATTTFTHEGTTGQGTLFLFGQKAGLDGTVTIKDGSGNGIALT